MCTAFFSLLIQSKDILLKRPFQECFLKLKNYDNYKVVFYSKMLLRMLDFTFNIKKLEIQREKVINCN